MKAKFYHIKTVDGVQGVIVLLFKGYTIHDMAKMTRKGVSTIQRVNKEFQL